MNPIYIYIYIYIYEINVSIAPPLLTSRTETAKKHVCRSKKGCSERNKQKTNILAHPEKFVSFIERGWRENAKTKRKLNQKK